MTSERSWDALAALADDIDYGTSWIPHKEPDHPNPLLGTVEGYHPATVGDTGETVIVCDIVDRDGNRWGVWLYGKDGGRGLDPDSGWYRQFRTHQPRVGERVALRDDGLHDLANPGARGSQFRKVVLAVDRERPMELADYMAPAQIQARSDIPTDDDPVDATVVEDKAARSAVDAEFDRRIAKDTAGGHDLPF